MVRRVLASFCFAMSATMLASCATNPDGGDSVWEAMRKGAVAGIQEELTGQEQPNPYLSGNGAAQPQQNASGNTDQQDLAARFGKKHAALIAQGHIDVGMNEEEVRVAWGDPSGKIPQGKTRETWNYGDDKVVFTRGKVSAVTH